MYTSDMNYIYLYSITLALLFLNENPSWQTSKINMEANARKLRVDLW